MDMRTSPSRTKRNPRRLVRMDSGREEFVNRTVSPMGAEGGCSAKTQRKPCTHPNDSLWSMNPPVGGSFFLIAAVPGSSPQELDVGTHLMGVLAPLEHVAAHVIKPEAIGGEAPHRGGPRETVRVVFQEFPSDGTKRILLHLSAGIIPRSGGWHATDGPRDTACRLQRRLGSIPCR